MIGKTNGKIRVAVNKLNSKVRVVFNYLPHATLSRIIAVNYLYNNIRIIVRHLDSEIWIFRYNLHPAIQRDAFATAGVTVDGLSGGKYRQQCEYKTTD